jgi:hypothetical protein
MSVFSNHHFIPSPMPNVNLPKCKLYDGVTDVTEISVMGMFRNNEPFLSNFLLKQLEVLEATYDVNFSYYFIENDSTDNTRKILKTWFEGSIGGVKKNGKLLLGKLTREYNAQKGECFDRTNTLAKLRNTLIDSMVPLTSQWTIFLDSHIYFPVNILERMLNDLHPAKQNIGMITPYTKQVYTNEQLKRMGINIRTPVPLPDNERIDLLHNFDTFTLITDDNVMYYPACPFRRCLICPYIRDANKKLPIIEPEQNIIDCRSTFNGFGLIDSSAFNHPRVRWDTIAYDQTGNMSLCDHVLMCDRLRTVTGKRIVLLQNIDDVLRTY